MRRLPYFSILWKTYTNFGSSYSLNVNKTCLWPSELGIFLRIGFDYQLYLFSGYSTIKFINYFIEYFLFQEIIYVLKCIVIRLFVFYYYFLLHLNRYSSFSFFSSSFLVYCWNKHYRYNWRYLYFHSWSHSLLLC